MKGLLSVSFGTSYADTRAKTIDVIDAKLRAAFSDRAFYAAWTSPRIVRKVAQRGEHHDLLEEAFERMTADGVDDLVVATMCLLQGGEMNRIQEQARAWEAEGGRRVRVAAPLMAEAADRALLAQAVANEFAHVPDDDALLLMGHGSAYGSNDPYADVQASLRTLGKGNFFMATVEGQPTFDDVLPLLEEGGTRRVVLAPFMVVAGDHARKDLAGTDGSWAARLQERGFETAVVMKGLGEYGAVHDLAVAHARNAARLEGEEG